MVTYPVVAESELEARAIMQDEEKHKDFYDPHVKVISSGFVHPNGKVYACQPVEGYDIFTFDSSYVAVPVKCHYSQAEADDVQCSWPSGALVWRNGQWRPIG